MGTALILLGLLVVLAGLICLVEVSWEQTELEMTELGRTLDAIDEIDAIAIAARSALLNEALKAEREDKHERR